MDNISTFYIVRANLQYYKFRTIMLISLIAIFSVSFIVTNIVLNTFSTSVTNVEKMLGADIIIAPSGYDKSMQEALFMGKPSTFVFERELVKDIASISGIDEVTDELLLASFNASCCDEELQMISVDYDENFILNKWLKNEVEKLDDFELIVGSEVTYKVGEIAQFFGKNFKVVGKIETTGMGYDVSVFVNKQTGKELQINAGYGEEEYISICLVNIDKDSDIEGICKKIDKMLTGKELNVYKASGFSINIKEKIKSLSIVANALLFGMTGMCFVSSFFIISMSLNERKREFATYEIIGCPLKKRLCIVFEEGILIAIIANTVGAILGITLLKLFSTYLATLLSIPINFTGHLVAFYVLESMIISIIVCGIATTYMAKIISKSNYTMLKEGK